MIFNNEYDIKNFLNSISDPALILNSDYTVNSINGELSDLFKLDMENCSNLHIDEMFTNSNIKTGIFKALEKVKSTGTERLNLSIPIDNRHVEFLLTLYGGDREKNSKYIILFFDVSKQKKQGRKLEMQNRLQEKENYMASLKTLSEGIAHEINNPNNVIMMNASILQKIFDDLLPILNLADLKGKNLGGFDSDTVSEKMKIMVEGIHYGAKRIKTLTAELRDFSAKDSGEFNKIDVNEIITSAVTSLEHTLKDKVKKLNINLSNREALFIRGIDYKMKEAIINLILNSIESLTGNEKELTINSHIDYKISKIVLLITDSGTGMDRKTLEHIKDPFFTTKRENGAIGLGLSITNRIIEEHNGNLVLISEPDSGTTAIIQLPLWEDL